MTPRLAGKTAVITGGTHGLGQAIATAFTVEGADVVCAARTDPRDNPGWPPQLRYLPVDVTDAESVLQLMDTAAEAMDGIDIVVASAGISVDGRVHRLPPQQWVHMVDVNLNGVFHTTRAAVPYLEKTEGTIINVSSSMASRVAVGAAGYCSTKAAVEMFSKVCAAELGPKKITVNCLAPGILDEGMGSELIANEGAWQLYRSRLIAGRAGRVSEAAAAAVYLATDEASYVNGHVLEVNGGLLWA